MPDRQQIVEISILTYRQRIVEIRGGDDCHSSGEQRIFYATNTHHVFPQLPGVGKERIYV